MMISHGMIPNAVAVVLLMLSCAQALLPAGFVDEGVARVRDVVDVAFPPNNGDNDISKNKLLAVTSAGRVYVVDTGSQGIQPQVVLDWRDRICDNGERGLQSVQFHPQFGTRNNRYIYLFYAYNRGNKDCPLDATDGPVNRVSRVTVSIARDNKWTVKANSERVLLQTFPLPDKVHNGGGILFGPDDGMLYIVTGDAGQRSLQWSQDRSNLMGSVLRITPDGKVPDDNPYAKTGVSCALTGSTTVSRAVCSEIYSYGLRNPFRFELDPHSETTRFLISDVGGRVWEEVNAGGKDYAGVNYGWPILEGPCDYDHANRCDAFADDLSEFQRPFFWYQHDEEESGCVVGPAIPPPGLNWPAPYNDPSSFYVADYVWGEFYQVFPRTTACSTCTPPTSGFYNNTIHTWPRPVSVRFGPYDSTGNIAATSHALYYVARNGRTNIRRIFYKGGNNFSPTAHVTAEPLNVPNNRGGDITFDATATLDRNNPGEELEFVWNFRDGSPEVTAGPIVTHRYSTVGVYSVELLVRDPQGASSRSSVDVSVGVPPRVEILTPVEGARFAVGEKFTLTGRARDHNGDRINGNTLEWTVRQHHNNHYHPFLSPFTKGNSIDLTEAPGPEDFFAATNSYLEVLLTGTDNRGISKTVSRLIEPKTVLLDFDSIPTGLVLTLDEQEQTTPVRVLTWENHNLRLRAPDQGRNVFKEWRTSNGGVVDVSATYDTIVVPPNNTKVPRYVAVFESTPYGISKELSVKGNNLIPASAFPLQNCEGDCDRDSDCAPGLSCFRRDGDGMSSVPGCLGEASGTVDYCYEAEVKILELVGDEGEPPEAFPLGLCQGDCDEDADCAGDNVCFQRGPDDSEVPGCGGLAAGVVDYCYAPNVS